MSTAVLISDSYLKLNQELHQRETSFGGGKHSTLVAQLIEAFQLTSLSDYGAGKMRLAQVLRDEFHLEFEYFPYDPAFPEYGAARSAELVCCIEVLEHVEPDCIYNVICDLANIVTRLGFFTVHCSDADKYLADGRNAHLLQRPINWWVTELSRFFDIQWLDKTSPESFAVVVTPKAPGGLGLPPLGLLQPRPLTTHLASFLRAARASIRREFLTKLRRP